MDPGPLRDALTAALGVGTGVLSGLFGVGGAVVSTPGIRALGASAAIAVGTTLPSIIPGAATGTRRYWRARLIDRRVVAATAPTGIAAAVGGSFLSNAAPGNGHLLMLATAGLLGFSAYRIGRTPAASTPDVPRADGSGVAPRNAVVRAATGRSSAASASATPRLDTDAEAAPEAALHTTAPAPISPEQLSRPLMRFAVVGAVAGLLSGLLGIGGGIVMVPGFTQFGRMGVKEAIATSLACVGLFAVPGTITHAFLGDIDWRFGLWLAAGIIPGARLGAALTLRIAERRLRPIVAAFLGITAVAYAASETVALIR